MNDEFVSTVVIDPPLGHRADDEHDDSAHVNQGPMLDDTSVVPTVPRPWLS